MATRNEKIDRLANIYFRSRWKNQDEREEEFFFYGVYFPTTYSTTLSRWRVLPVSSDDGKNTQNAKLFTPLALSFVFIAKDLYRIESAFECYFVNGKYHHLLTTTARFSDRTRHQRLFIIDSPGLPLVVLVPDNLTSQLLYFYCYCENVVLLKALCCISCLRSILYYHINNRRGARTQVLQQSALLLLLTGFIYNMWYHGQD